MINKRFNICEKIPWYFQNATDWQLYILKTLVKSRKHAAILLLKNNILEIWFLLFVLSTIIFFF